MPMSHHILIVEDDPAVSRSFALYLRHKGYEVDCAPDGLEGVEHVKNGEYDLAITDVMMPRMNGLQFLEAVKELKPTLPVIMITGYTDLETAIESMKKGAVDFVTKPFRYDDLEQTIHNLLEGNAIRHFALSTDDLQQRLEHKVHELSVLYSINEALDSSTNIDDLFAALTELSCQITEARSSIFLMYDRESSQFFIRHAFAEDPELKRTPELRLDPQVMEDLEVQRAPMVWNSPKNLKFYQAAIAGDYAVNSLILAPLYVRGENFGILAIENKKGAEGFTQTDLNFVKVLLKKASLQIENNALYETIYNNLVDTLRSLVTTLEAKDTYTQRHSIRVTRISLLLAQEVGCTKEELDILQFAGMLHDIGKIGISDSILQKNGRLTDEEYEIIKLHPGIGAKILEPLGMLPHEKAIIRYHHERWDGRGYPEGLAGRDIPYLARIVSVADAYEAMTADRVYRKKLTHEAAIGEIKRNAWYQFDGNLVQAFLQLCERHGDKIEQVLD